MLKRLNVIKRYSFTYMDMQIHEVKIAIFKLFVITFVITFRNPEFINKGIRREPSRNLQECGVKYRQVPGKASVL